MIAKFRKCEAFVGKGGWETIEGLVKQEAVYVNRGSLYSHSQAGCAIDALLFASFRYPVFTNGVSAIR